MENVIEFSNVSFSYENNRNVLDNISLAIPQGGSVGLIGANGIGKSTLMKLLLGLVEGYEGTAKVCGLPVNKKNIKEIRKKVGYVLQDSDNQLFMPTVYQDVCFGPLNYGYTREEVDNKAQKALELTGCTELRDKAVYKLSGGEKKLVAIATILSMEPEVVIMDEPESSLDPRNRKRLIDIIKSMPGTKIIASHDLDFIWETTEQVILLGNGQVQAFDATKTVLSNEQLLLENNMVLPYSAIIDTMKKDRK